MYIGNRKKPNQHEIHVYHVSFFLLTNFSDYLQDVDAGYLSKVDLEDKVAGIADELNFLRSLYDMVGSY